LLVYGTCREAQEGEGSYCVPIHEGVIWVLVRPAEHMEAHGRTKILVTQHT